MSTVFGDYSRLFRFFYVADFIGSKLLSISAFSSIVKRFVFGEKAVVSDVGRKRKREDGESDSSFLAETESIYHLFSELNNSRNDMFKAFHILLWTVEIQWHQF